MHLYFNLHLNHYTLNVIRYSYWIAPFYFVETIRIGVREKPRKKRKRKVLGTAQIINYFFNFLHLEPIHFKLFKLHISSF